MNWRWIVIVIALASCGRDGAKDNATGDSTNLVDTISGTSLYNLTSEWMAQDSTSLQLVDLRGRPRVLAMIYTSCKAACPRIVADMRHIETELGDDAKEVGFVLVSIDPEHDTPDRLNAFAHENSLDSSRWTLLYGASADVLELAAVLGVNYKKTTPLDYAHSNIITVLNETGDVVYQQEGLGTDPTATIDTIKELVKTPS